MRKILAIDDKTDNLVTISAVIKNYMEDCEVFTALSGIEGIEIAREKQPDTILLDIIMPEMDGFDTCKNLKADELTKHIPVIMITAIKTDAESRAKGLNMGADAFLSKPIDPTELSAQVNVMLRIKKAEDKLRAEKESLDRKVKEQMKDLKESDELNRSITQSAADAIISINIDGIILSWNLAAEKIFGYPSSEMINRKLSVIIPDYYKGGHSYGINRLKRGGNEKLICKTIELTAIKKDGKEFPIELSLSTWKTGNQKNYTGIIRDITERNRKDKIQKVLYNISNAAISSGNLKKLIKLIQLELGTIIDTTNFFVALYNSDDDTLSLPFITDEKKEPKHFPAGKTLTKYVINTQTSLLGTKEKLMELEESGEIEVFGTRAKIWLGVPLITERKVSGVFAVQSYTDKFAYDKSDLEMLEFVADQISISIERKKAEQWMKGALDKATESDRLKSAFLATMSHELRTPLNAIIGFSDLIDEDMPVADIVDFTKIINSSGIHLLSIVESIFDISLIESGETRIVEEDVNILTILNDVFEIIKIEQQNTQKEHLKLDIIFPKNNTDIIIHTDSSKLKQILINLLKNALKFTHKGHVNFGYSIETIQGKYAIKFFVEDTGIGIDPDKFGLIFELFRQIEDSNTRKYGGTGIGLSISKKLTEILGGRIWLDSEKEDLTAGLKGGSTFYFFIPFEDFGKTSSPIKTVEKEDDILKGKTALIVEDDEDSYELLKMLLNKSGINPDWAIDSKTAIKYCKENQDLGLILMDINMPDVDGYEATRQIRTFNKEVVIIAQTAYALAGDREKALEVGCNDYITKPIDKDELMKMIKRLSSDFE